MNEFMKSGTALENFKGISDFIDLEIMQNILDHLAKATGLAFVTVDHRGRPVTRYSGFTKFCNILRTHDEYRESCYKCDEVGGLRAAVLGEPYFYLCHANLLDFAIPIMLRGNYLGAVMAGQVKVKKGFDSEIEFIMDRTAGWEKHIELQKSYDEIPEVSFEKVTSTAYTLQEMTKYIVGKEYLNIVKEQLGQKHIRYIQEERRRSELSESLKEAELKALQYQINPHFLFNALNTICGLAYIEGAKRTEEVSYAFSEMMRYILRKNTSQLMKLREEITHSTNYLKVQKTRLGERLNYTIDVPDKYGNISCPFMMIQPLIENSVKYAVEVKEEGGTIEIKAYEDNEDLVIIVEDDGEGISKETIRNILSNDGMGNENRPSDKEQIGLANVNRRLIYFFGEEYGLNIVSPSQDEKGTAIIIRLPLNGL